MTMRGIEIWSGASRRFQDCGVEFFIDDDNHTIGADIYGPSGDLIDRIERVITRRTEITIEWAGQHYVALYLALMIRLATETLEEETNLAKASTVSEPPVAPEFADTIKGLVDIALVRMEAAGVPNDQVAGLLALQGICRIDDAEQLSALHDVISSMLCKEAPSGEE